MIELGAGSALCGLVAAKKGANVVVTDVADEALALAYQNAKGNDSE